jgi:hypothetical protein
MRVRIKKKLPLVTNQYWILAKLIFFVWLLIVVSLGILFLEGYKFQRHFEKKVLRLICGLQKNKTWLKNQRLFTLANGKQYIWFE